MNDNESFDGGCTCGGVRYRMESQPLIVHCCHCTWCQRQTGTSYALNALIESARVTLLAGEPRGVATSSPSGKGQDIFRCPDCSVAVWSHYGGAGDKIKFIRVGTLDEAHRLSPDIHIYTSTKQPWIVIPEGMRAVPEYYRSSEVWSPESIERAERLL